MNNELKFDWNDITLVPAAISDISSRKEISPYKDNTLPLFTAPMDTVIDEDNVDDFVNNNINICLPRHLSNNKKIKKNKYKDSFFFSFGLDEIIKKVDNDERLPEKVLIDIANGHMRKLYDVAKKIKQNYNIELMVGNIANPDTYLEYCKIGVDYIRVSIGSGSVCTTSANASIHFPLASLVYECAQIKKEFENPTKIIADGGFKNHSDIIKAIALGADYVMIGSVFNKSLESCSDSYLKNDNGDYYKVDKNTAKKTIESGNAVYKYYRGMSTKEVQKFWKKEKLTTGEGISKYNKVEYSLYGWTENFVDYLKSAMSYCNSKRIDDFSGGAKWVKITQNSFNRFNK